MCRHVLAALKAIGTPVHTVMPTEQTSAGWKASYDACGMLRVPSTAEYAKFAHLQDDRLYVPPVIKTRTGRPKKGKRIRSAIEKFKEKNKKKRLKKK